MRETFEARRIGSLYAVFNSADERVSGWLCRDHAHGKAADMNRRQAWKTRKCLRCGHDFMSEWAGNRMCMRCRAKASDDTADYSLAL